MNFAFALGPRRRAWRASEAIENNGCLMRPAKVKAVSPTARARWRRARPRGACSTRGRGDPRARRGAERRVQPRGRHAPRRSRAASSSAAWARAAISPARSPPRLASTGTPAQFIHPAEASHGDLGVLTRADALLMLSMRGETAELSDLITYAKRFRIPLIGMASNAESTLLQASDVALVLPTAHEACPMGLAPTTSTTMMLVLGDALAVALMERRGFSADQYRDFHPGGSLGPRADPRLRPHAHGRRDAAGRARRRRCSTCSIAIAEHRFGCVGVTRQERRADRHHHRRRSAPPHGPRPARPQGRAM